MCPQPPLQMPHTKNAQVQVAKISRWRLQSLICIQQNQTEFKFQYGTDNWSKMRRDKEGNGAGGKVMEIKAPCERPKTADKTEKSTRLGTARKLLSFASFYALWRKNPRFCMDKKTRLWQEISVASISLPHHSNSSGDPKFFPSPQPKGGDDVCMPNTLQHVLTHLRTPHSSLIHMKAF